MTLYPTFGSNPGGIFDFRHLRVGFGTSGSRFLASSSQIWAMGVRICVLGVDFGPMRVNFGYLGDDFLTSASRFWAYESHFRAYGSSFLWRISALFFEFEASGSNF